MLNNKLALYTDKEGEYKYSPSFFVAENLPKPVICQKSNEYNQLTRNSSNISLNLYKQEREMIYKVYVLYAPNHDKLFTGMTTNLSDRMVSHNGNEPEDWTSVYQPWTLVHMELYNDESEALLRETFLESLTGQDYVRDEILPLFQFSSN